MASRRAILCGAAAALLLLGAALALDRFAPPPDRPNEPPEIDALAAALDLDAGQRAAAARLAASVERRAAPLLRQSDRELADIHRLLASADPDAAEVGARVIAAHRTRLAIDRLRAELRQRLSVILTAGQRSRLDRLDLSPEPPEWPAEGGFTSLPELLI